MRVAISWVKRHPWAVVVLVLASWLVIRRLAGKGRGGHDSPAAAVAAGWEIYPAGITGWKEVEPGTGREFWHLTGWSQVTAATG